MRVLVTGGAGFIGAATTWALQERGDDVVVLDNFLTGRPDSLPADVRVIKADLRDSDAVRTACRDVQVVLHIGAVRSVLRSVEDPQLVAECNIGGTLNVLEGAKSAGVRRVVYASSSSVYGEGGEAVQREGAPPNPISPYAVSKLSGEHYCRVWTQLHALSTVSLRYFNVFGPGQHAESRYSNVFPAFVSALVHGRPPELHWDGEQSRDFTFIDDVVRANLLAADADDGADGQVINIGGGKTRAINEVLRSVSDAVGKWIEPRRCPQRPGDVRRTHADITRARELLGWQPSVPWKEAVARTVDWFRAE